MYTYITRESAVVLGVVKPYIYSIIVPYWVIVTLWDAA